MFRTLLLLGLLVPSSGAMAQEVNWEQLLDVNRRFAEAGSKEGQFKLAEMYEEGRGTAVDLDAARSWYEKAAKQGHTEAQQRVSDWDTRQSERARQSELARKKAEEEKARQAALAAQKKAEEERRAEQEAQRRAEEEKARQAAQKRAEEEKAQKAAAQRRAEEEKARQAAQKRFQEQNASIPWSDAEKPQTGNAKAASAPAPAPTPTAAKPDGKPTATEAQGTPAADNFESDPCKTPAAKFMSTCRNR